MAGAKKSSKMYLVGCVLGMLVTGTVNTLSMKIQFTVVSVGTTGTEVFQKPWFGAFNMLLAMSIVGLVDKLMRCFSKAPKVATVDMENGAAKLLKEAPESASQLSWGKKVCIVAIPGFFDLLATGLCCVGILYVPASVWQILRGGAIVFCGVFSVTFLKRQMFLFNWLGIVICVVGLSLVGLASVWGASASAAAGTGTDTTMLMFGMGLVLIGQVVQGAQVTLEEWLMKDVDLPAMQIVGWEGVWGTLCMIVLVYPVLWLVPGSDHGHVEDPIDTAVMIWNSPKLAALIGLYLVSCATFNVTGIAVTGALSATHRMMMDASRTMVIWAFGLVVHYHFDPRSPFGEVWTPYSFLQLLGFVVMVTGQGIFGEVIKVPGLWYPKAQPNLFGSPSAAMKLASPLPRMRLSEEELQ